MAAYFSSVTLLVLSVEIGYDVGNCVTKAWKHKEDRGLTIHLQGHCFSVFLGMGKREDILSALDGGTSQNQVCGNSEVQGPGLPSVILLLLFLSVFVHAQSD